MAVVVSPERIAEHQSLKLESVLSEPHIRAT
jgi:hypothetical protein